MSACFGRYQADPWPTTLPQPSHPQRAPQATMPCLTHFARARAAMCGRSPRSYRPDVSRRQLSSAAVTAVLADLDAGRQPSATLLRDAVRVLLSELATTAPGRSVEMR